MLRQKCCSENASFFISENGDVNKYIYLTLCLQNGKITLAGVAQWIECHPENQRVTRSDSHLGHTPGLRARSPVGGVGEAASHTLMFLSLSSPRSKNKLIKSF